MASAFNLTAQINLRGPANLRTVVASMRRQLGSINANVNVNIASGAARSVSSLNTRLTRLNTTLANTRTNVNDVTNAVNALAAAMRGIPNIPPIVPPNLPRAARDLNAVRTEMEEFGRQTGLAIRRFAAFSVGTAGIYGLINAANEGIKSFIAFNKEMTRLQQVTGESQNSLKRVSDEITLLSTTLGVASSDLLNVATTLAQAGLSAKDTEKALKALALSALAPSFDDLNSTVEGSIALMKQFGIGAGDLEGALGSINAVAAKFAVEAGDIIAAIQRTGGVFAAASRGVSEGTDALNEFISVFTSVRATTRESAETIATGLRTIFTRIQRASTIEALKDFGITLTDTEGKFVGAYKAVQLLSDGLNRLDPRNLKFSEIVEELGGFRQIGKVIPLIQQFTTAQQALAVAQKGSGSLAEDAATAQLSLANQISKVREEFFALFREIGGSDSFQIMAKATLSLASGLIKLADAAKGVLPIVGTIMALRGLQGAGQFLTGFRGGIRPRGAASGGVMRYAGGDTIRAMVSNGEAFIPPEKVRQIGVNRLKRMNQADRTKSRKYASGGDIGIFKGPGSGTSDSIGPIDLPVGSFIIREKATKALGFNNGGKISKFSDGDYVEGSALKALKQLTRDFLMPKSRKGGRRSVSFLTQKAVSISKNMPPELLKQIQGEGRLVSGTGIGSLAKGEPGLIVDKIIRMAMDKTKKSKERKINAQTLRNFAKAGIESADPEIAEKMIQSMTSADVQKAFAGSLKRAPAGRVEQLRKQYESDKQFQATISGGSIKAFEDDTKKKIFRRADFIDKIPDLADKIKTFEAGLIKKLAQTKDPKEQRSLQQQIQKTSGALRVIKQQGGVPGSTADGTYLSWATRQTTPRAKELARGGSVQKFPIGGLGTSRPKKSLLDLGRQAIVGAANDVGLALTAQELQSLRVRKNQRTELQSSLVSNLVERIESFRSTTKAAQISRQQLLEKQAKLSGVKFGIAGMKGKTSTTSVELPSTQRQKGVAATLFTGTMQPKVAKEIKGILRRFGEQMVKEGAEAIARAAGTKRAGMKEIRDILRSKDLSWEGIMQEKMIGAAQSRSTGGRYDPKIKRGVDFPKGVGEKLAKVLGVPPDIALDIVRTVSDRAISRKLPTFTRTIEESGGLQTFNRDTRLRQRERRLEEQRKRRTQSRRMASGGEIPIMAQKGEYIINKESAQAIGYNNLHSLNKYHSGGVIGQGAVPGFAAGGIVANIGRVLAQLTDSIRRFSTNIARVPSGGGWLGRPIPGMPATGMGSRAAARGRAPGMIPDDNMRGSRLQNSAFALSMALPVINEMIQGNQEPTSAAAASNRAFSGTLATGLGGSLALASMGGTAGPIGAVVVGLGSLVKAFADSENAIREFNIKDSTEILNNQLELTSKSLNQFDKDINNADTRTKALADVLNSITKAQSVTAESERPMVGVFNLLDEGVGSFERSVILFDKGISSYLQTLSFFAGGEENARANQATLFAKSIPKIAKERAASFGGVSENIIRLLETEIKKTGNLDALRANDAEFKKLTSSLALADVQVQEQILRVRNNNTLRDEEKENIINGIIARAGENKAIEITNRAMREKAIDELNKAASRASFSLELMFTEMEQSINKSNFAIDKLKESSELAAASLSGQAKIGQTRLNAINVLQNPRAYSNRENMQASSLGASAFGTELEPAIQGLLRFGPILQDTVMSTINQVLTTTPKQELNNEVIAAKISRAVRQSLDRLKLPPELAAKLSNEVGKQIEELRKSGEDKVDFSQLMEKIPALANVVDSAKRAQESAIQALENWQKSLNTYSDAFNRITELQIQNNERSRRSSDILYQGQLELAKAFGEPTNLRGAINNFNATIASMSGGFTAVGDIMQQIQDLERIRQQQQNLQNDAANRGQQGTQAFMVMTDNLKNTNIKLRESYNALEQLSQSSEIAAAAMGRIAELQQKQQAGIGIMEKLVTSTPEELSNFGNALQRLQANMMGRANYGTTAEQRGESLQAFNMIAPLLGGMEGAVKANVLESMLKEANAPLTPFFAQILDSLRNPAADPEMKQAIDIYKASLQQQTLANSALNTLNNQTIKENADFAAKQITIGFRDVLQNFESRQLKNIADGINNLVQIFRNRPPAVPAAGKALGGMIYADNGMFVPKGTDTVPAMLTPGEFVVNRQATQKNLPLLKSINNGSKGYSRGGVAYLADGGLVSLYDKANPIGGNDYETTKKATDKLMASTDKELYDVPMDIRKTLSKSFEEVLAVKPVYYANATSYRPGESRGTGWGLDWRPVKPLELGRDRIDTMAGFGLIADSISVDPFNGYAQKPSFLQSSKFSFFLPTLNILDQLSSIKNQQISDIDEFKLDAKLEKYKDLYAYVIESLSKDSRGLSIKYNESSMELGGVKVLSSVNSKPSLKPKVQGFSLNNIADFGKEFLGPFPKLDLSGDSIATKSPLGFATIIDGAGNLKRFYPTAGGSSIGAYSSVTGYGTPIGNLIHENGFDIEDLLNRNINKNITDNLSKKIPDVVNRSKESLDQLDSIKIIGSEYALRNEELQKRLYNLYNNQKFSDTFEFPDIAGTDSISLYNIRNQKQWDDILTQIQNTQEGAQPGKNIASTKDWYRLFFDPFGGGGTRSIFLPWTKNFSIDKEILSGAEAQTIAAQNWIKKASTETYKNKNLMFNYNKISGYLFDKEIGSFDVDGGIKDFITIPFGGESLVQNPFAALPQSQQFAYFDNIAQLDAFINQILDETTKNKANDSINLDSIFKTDVEKYGTFNDLIKNNSYLKKDGKIPLNLPLNKFIEEYNKSKRVRELDQGFAVPGAGGVAGDLFDLLKTPKNLLDISSGTVRSPEISRIGGGLGYRLAALKNPDQLGSYVGYLNDLVSTINRDRRAGKVQNYRGGSYTKYNENFVKLYSMIETSRNAFQAIAGNDIGGLSRLIGINAGGLVQNGALIPDSINTIIGAIKNRAAGKAQGILSGGAAQPILSQTTTALDDVLRADREAVEIADIDPNTGKIIGYKPATEQAAEGKTIEQVGKLALNPYNFFKGDTRKSLIDSSIIKAIDNQIRKLRSNKRTPRDLLAKTYGIKNDVGIVRNWFSGIHDRVLNVPIDQAMIEAGDIDNLKNQIDEILDPTGNDNAIDSNLSRLASSNFDLSNKALSRLTGGTYALGPSGIPTPLLDFDRMLDLLIERKNIKIKQEAAAVGKANGGVIYASNGTLVNFKPKGTDTVPAMLTPGEFVVNRRATQKNLPLLKSINSGQSSSSNYAIGGVVNSTTPTLDQNTINQAVANTINQFGSKLDNVDKNTTATKKTIDKQFKSNKLFSSGGMVYASKGQLIGGKAKGSDTVPAMLTPGEFVVNKKATQNNLGLLKTMNKGGVIYAQSGGYIPWRKRTFDPNWPGLTREQLIQVIEAKQKYEQENKTNPTGKELKVNMFGYSIIRKPDGTTVLQRPTPEELDAYDMEKSDVAKDGVLSRPGMLEKGKSPTPFWERPLYERWAMSDELLGNFVGYPGVGPQGVPQKRAGKGPLTGGRITDMDVSSQRGLPPGAVSPIKRPQTIEDYKANLKAQYYAQLASAEKRFEEQARAEGALGQIPGQEIDKLTGKRKLLTIEFRRNNEIRRIQEAYKEALQNAEFDFRSGMLIERNLSNTKRYDKTRNIRLNSQSNSTDPRVNSLIRLASYDQATYDQFVDRLLELTGPSGEIPGTLYRGNLAFDTDGIKLRGVGTKAPYQGDTISNLFRASIFDRAGKDTLVNAFFNELKDLRQRFVRYEEGQIKSDSGRSMESLIDFANKGDQIALDILRNSNYVMSEGEASASTESKMGYHMQLADKLVNNTYQDALTKLETALSTKKPTDQSLQKTPRQGPAQLRPSSKIRIIKPSDPISDPSIRGDFQEIIAIYEDSQSGDPDQSWGRVSAVPFENKIYKIETSLVKRGYGPKLYDALLEYISKTGGELIPDVMGGVQPEAQVIWQKYKDRADINKRKWNPDGPDEWFNYIYSKSGASKLQDNPNAIKAEQATQKMYGGMIYASSGQYVNFKPKGSDTVPAMLTPGEFVVNKQATQKNLPLLKSINNGAKGYNKGGVAYLARGGIAEQIQKEGRAQLSDYYASQLAELGDKWFISNNNGIELLAGNRIGRSAILTQDKKPIFPATKFLSSIKEGKYTLIQALDQAQAKELAQNTPELRNLDWKKEKLIPAKSILQKFINQKEKRNQEFYNFYQRELNLAPDLFERNNDKAFSQSPQEQTLSDKFKQYVKDPKKLENIRLDLYDRFNWLRLIAENNQIAGIKLLEEKNLNPDIGLGYDRLKDYADLQLASARLEGDAINAILKDPKIFNAITASPPNRFSKGRSFNFQDPVTKNSLQNIIQTKKYANGGIVYASNGQRIKKSSLGSDTVPAMLTPGEFVVNKKAAQQNLPLLQTMNSGGMVYLARGGEAYRTEQENRRRQYEDMMQARRDALAADKLARQRRAAGNFVIEGNRPTIRSQGPVPVPAAQQQQNVNNPQNMNKADDFLTKLGGKIDLFGNYVQKLADLKIPDKIQMNIVAEPIQVVITGSAALESMSEGIQQMVTSQINKKMGQLWGQTEGALGTNPATAQSRNV